MRHTNTANEMLTSGAWVMVGRKHYRHVSGVEIRYDCNRWAWEVKGNLYQTLWAARYEAERA